MLLSHADRTRIITVGYRKRGVTTSGRPTLLVDDFFRGTWKVARQRGTATLVIAPFEPLLQRERDALAEEGERLVRFVGEGAQTFEVRFAEP